MRENDGRQAVLAFLGGVAMMAAALGAFLVVSGISGGGAGERAKQQPVHREQPRPRPTSLAEGDPPAPALNCLAPDSCRQPTLSLLGLTGLNAKNCEGSGRRVCLVPLGEVPADLVLHLVDYYDSEYELELRVLPSVPLESGFDRDQQLEADGLHWVLERTYPEQFYDPDVVLIGLTSIDIYTAHTPEWSWFFGATYRAPADELPRQAILSAFRMDPVNWGGRRNDALRDKRVRTLMNKYIAMTYYGLPLNDNPRSVLFRQITSLQTLDGIDERIPVLTGLTTGIAQPTPNAAWVTDPTPRQLGEEIAKRYLEALTASMDATRDKRPAGIVEQELAAMRDDYKAQMEALGCRTDSMSDEERKQVFEAAEAYQDRNRDEDFGWFVATMDFYGPDSRVGRLLWEINVLVEYALPDPF
ncbi:MAG TPA: hypothetical protein VIC04_04940, partial [Terriglobia bacterium]